MKKYYLLVVSIFYLISCNNDSHQNKIILKADREAPLGWIYLRIYQDSTFEFESKGLERRGDIYSGKMSMNGDTIFFKYHDSIPKAGSTAIIGNEYVAYIDGTYPERVKIKFNELTN